MSFFEQVHRKVGGVVDGGLPVALAVEAAALGEQIESALGYVHLQSGDVLGELHYQVAAALKGLTHILDTLLIAGIGELCSLLADGAGTAGVLALQFVASFDNPLGGSDVTDAPACHGVGFRHTVDDDRALLHARELGDGLVLADVVDMFVDLVGQHKQVVVAEDDVGEGLQFFLAIDAARGVAGRTEDNQTCLGGDSGFQLFGVILKFCSKPASTMTGFPPASSTI